MSRAQSIAGVGAPRGLAPHRNHVGAVERGEQNIAFRVLLKLARGLNVPRSELIEIHERNRRELR